jgi:GMP synthase-like glutamine amidotransferase
MKPVAIIQHDTHDGPSYFATWLAERGIAYEVFRMFEGASLTGRIADYCGLCILGGPISANDALPYFGPLLAQVREAIDLDIPVIGHCLGGQLLSRALGGTVQASENTEIGWSQLEPVHADASQWFGDAAPLQLFQWHGESFSIPPDAVQLLRGAHCANQAYVMGGMHLGMQFHCEVDDAKVREWLTLGAVEMQGYVSPGVQQADAILQTLDIDLARSQRIASHIYARWAQGLKRVN